MSHKVALMTIFQVPNYGSVLQTFATQTILGKLGYDCDIINYNYPNGWHFRNGFIKTPLWRRVLRRFFNATGLHRQELSNSLNTFRRKLNRTRRFKDLDALKNNDWSEYSVIIAGSDQLWNPTYLKGDSAFMLSFAPGIPKMSIASSFAVSELPPEFIEKYRKHLSGFSAISVRENSGVRIIRETLSLNVDPRVVLDPTLLLSADEWMDSLKITRAKSHERYILMYLLSYALDPYPAALEAAKQLKERYGCTKIITFSKKNSPEVRELNAESKHGCSVEDFLYYIANAEAIVTSSFHGTAFAVNFGIPLVSITPSNNDGRQMTLLRALDIEKCSIPAGEGNQVLSPDYNVADVHRKLDNIRHNDIAWISDNLSRLQSADFA